MGRGMETERLEVVGAEAGDPAIRRAAELLREGELVAFPTETVYGLGARAGDAAAVRKIFEAKGRPATVPLIIHVRDFEQARAYFDGDLALASALAGGHWPGPLTLVMDRSRRVPDAVTAGGPTVGVRAPAHPVALALIEALGEGIAAPSANLYNRLPPVRAQHVFDGLGGRIAAVLDGGRCPGGLESTVVDVRHSPGVVLRRGAVGASVLGLEARSVGMAPEEVAGSWIELGRAEAFQELEGVGRLTFGPSTSAWVRTMPADPTAYAAELYDTLHAFWSLGCERVWVDALPREPSWGPLWDRLVRLASSLPRPEG